MEQAIPGHLLSDMLYKTLSNLISYKLKNPYKRNTNDDKGSIVSTDERGRGCV